MNQGEQALEPLRKAIDELDLEILLLLRKRFDVTDQVGQVKKQYGMRERDDRREESQFKRIARAARDLGIDEELAQGLLRLIIEQVIVRHRELLSKN